MEKSDGKRFDGDATATVTAAAGWLACATVQGASACAKSKAFRKGRTATQGKWDQTFFSIGFICRDLVKSTTGVFITHTVCVCLCFCERARARTNHYIFHFYVRYRCVYVSFYRYYICETLTITHYIQQPARRAIIYTIHKWDATWPILFQIAFSYFFRDNNLQRLLFQTKIINTRTLARTHHKHLVTFDTSIKCETKIDKNNRVLLWAIYSPPPPQKKSVHCLLFWEHSIRTIDMFYLWRNVWNAMKRFCLCLLAYIPLCACKQPRVCVFTELLIKHTFIYNIYIYCCCCVTVSHCHMVTPDFVCI